jgi:hypothetical protein
MLEEGLRAQVNNLSEIPLNPQQHNEHPLEVAFIPLQRIHGQQLKPGLQPR